MSEQIIVLPGLIDMHVHLREPGATHKETFESGTKAALAGGVTTLVDMPNNPNQTINSYQRLIEKRYLADGKIYADVGFYYGSQPADSNIGSFEHILPFTRGLKSYLEPTTGNEAEFDPRDFGEIWRWWHELAAPTQPIILHAESRIIEPALNLVARRIGHPTHVAHVSNRTELEAVIKAKERGWPVTCGVTPHHLFMTSYAEKKLGWYARMKPPLASPEDQEFLWSNLDAVDVFETDHAPHTKEEKESAQLENPDANPSGIKSYGVPGLEAMLPLFLQAVKYGRLSLDQLMEKTSTNPARILGLKPDDRTNIRVSMEQYEFGPQHVKSKCGWSPYIGHLVTGKVIQVDLRGQTVYSGGSMLKNQAELYCKINQEKVMVEFAGRIGHLENIESPWGNAGGVVKTLQDVERMENTGVGWIEAGSYTLEPRAGNSPNGERVYYHDANKGETYNSLGMPNKGMDVVEKEIPVMAGIAHAYGKKLIINVAPVSNVPVTESVDLIRRAHEASADAVILNAGCPNVLTEGGGRHELLSRDAKSLFEVLKGIARTEIRTMVRISPQESFASMAGICVAIRKSGIVTAVFLPNAWPGHKPLNEKGQEILQVPGGVGGKSGPNMADEAAMQTRWAAKLLENSGIDVISSSSIMNAEELKRRLDLGAVAAAGTTFYYESVNGWSYDTDKLLSDLGSSGNW